MKRITLICLMASTVAILFLTGSNCRDSSCANFDNTSKKECEAQTDLQGRCVWVADPVDATGKKGTCWTHVVPPAPTPKASSSCKVTGNINSFQVVCTKDITYVCIAGLCGGQTLAINGVSLKKIDATHVQGSAPGQGTLTFRLEHSDGTESEFSI